jgi:hypothetical protein
MNGERLRESLYDGKTTVLSEVMNEKWHKIHSYSTEIPGEILQISSKNSPTNDGVLIPGLGELDCQLCFDEWLLH